MRKVYLAADVGAGSGRVLAGIFEDGKISLDEIRRFDNQPVENDGSYHWSIHHIFGEIKAGIKEAIAAYGEDVVSIGVDTWGVDYGLLDQSGELIDSPYCYRDSRTDEMIKVADKAVEQAARYAIAGLQTMHFNTLYQLLADLHVNDDRLKNAESLLFIPDLLNYWLSGEKANEETIASTSELLEAGRGKWSELLIERYELPRKIFQPLKAPGDVLGSLTDEIATEVGGNINVVNVPSHDTAAAVAACPLSSANSIYISSGTWSLMGIESEKPFTDSLSNAMTLTNERGVEGTTRLLKNISGFWIFQQCKRDWDSKGFDYNYDQLRDLAIDAEPFQAFLDTNDPGFEMPGNMLAKVEKYFEKTGQNVDMEPALVCRTIFEGLAFSYRKVIGGLEKVTDQTFDTIHIIGGGSQNFFLNQLVADATGCRVIAGPVEASGLGNVLAQLKADQQIDSFKSGREIIQKSFDLKLYEPQSILDWSTASDRYLKTTVL